MACFIVPATEAIVTTIASKIVKKHENDSEKGTESCGKKFSEKLGWLSKLLWGGSGLLAFEHLWHGEIVPYYPFLTAAYDPEETQIMLHEMGTAGVAMAVLVTAVWAGMVIVSKKSKKDGRLPGRNRDDSACNRFCGCDINDHMVYKKGARELKAGSLCCMYWGASLMWLIDAVFGYAEDGAGFFVPAAADMLNDLYLGLAHQNKRA